MTALEARDLIAILALYGAIYYGLARSAMRQLRAVDPDCYSKLGANAGLGMRNSIAVLRMLFDQELPKPSYPVSVSRKITAARYMLVSIPAAFLGALLLAKEIGYIR